MVLATIRREHTKTGGVSVATYGFNDCDEVVDALIRWNCADWAYSVVGVEYAEYGTMDIHADYADGFRSRSLQTRRAQHSNRHRFA